MGGEAPRHGGGAWRRVAPTTTAPVGSSGSVGPASGETWSSSEATAMRPDRSRSPVLADSGSVGSCLLIPTWWPLPSGLPETA